MTDYTGSHYFSDVVAGGAIGFMVGYLIQSKTISSETFMGSEKAETKTV